MINNEIEAVATISAMVFVILFVEYSFSRGRATKKMRYLLYFILIMMASMFVGLSWYLVEPKGFLSTIIAINIIMTPMISALVILFYFYSIEWKRKHSTDRVFIPALFVTNEVLMTIFVMILMKVNLSPNLLIAIPQSVNSLYFVLPMEMEMAVSIMLFRIKGSIRALLIVLAAMDLVSPALFSSHPLDLLVVNALIMVSGMILIMEDASNSKMKVSSERKRIIDISIVIYLLNSAGFFVAYGSGPIGYTRFLPYALSVMLGMGLYFFFVFSGRSIATVDGWAKRKWWLFFMLSGTFVTELMMSIPLGIFTGEFSISGAGLASMAYLVTHPIGSGGALSFNGNIALSVVPFIATVANSPMFLLLMGLEMGTLVVIRIKRIKWLEKRINLSFALLAYFTYTLFGPNYVLWWSKVPLWANVGAEGPVSGYLILPMIVSYAVYAVLALLFGRRSYCSTLCPSAVMYGGTLGQEMISLNYGSRLSKKNIGSKFSSFVMKIIAGAWIFMIISAVASFAISLSVIKLPFDPAVLYSYLIWNLLWYIFFISIPFVGMSPCRRYGWCTTGTFVGFFSKLGFFKIKAVDPNVCFRCPTKDCVKACEVGLGDLPGQFIKKGFFKSQKCVGAGTCIEACPYDNIHFYDVRNVIKDRLALRSRNNQTK